MASLLDFYYNGDQLDYYTIHYGMDGKNYLDTGFVKYDKRGVNISELQLKKQSDSVDLCYYFYFDDKENPFHNLLYRWFNFPFKSSPLLFLDYFNENNIVSIEEFNILNGELEIVKYGESYYGYNNKDLPRYCDYQFWDLGRFFFTYKCD